MNQTILKGLSKLIGHETAYAHCDLPCGIYDPHQAIIGALTAIRMADILAELKGKHAGEDHQQDYVRAVIIKESHADLVKKEVGTIMGDYFKPEMIEKYPDLHKLTHSIMQAASKAKQNEGREYGVNLLELVNQFAEIFWQSKGKETKRVISPYKPEMEMVIPVL